MADTKKKAYHKKKIQDTKDSNFGNYEESTGGGQPFEKGDTNTRTTRANGKIRQQKNDTEQPRDDKGRFQYNSVNGKGLKYPSRGKTVNPLLTGGVGGIYIDDVKAQFEAKSGEYWDKYKDKWYQKGSEIVINGKVKIASEAIWDVARHAYKSDIVHVMNDANLQRIADRYFDGDINEARTTIMGNAALPEAKKGEGGFEGESEVFDETKKGRHSKEEKAAIKKAKGKEAPVIEKETGGIKVKGEKAKQPAEPTKPGDTPSEPQSVSPASGGKTFGSGKYTSEEAEKARQELKSKGQWNDAFNDDALFEKFMDKYWTSDDDGLEDKIKNKMGV